MSQSNTQSYIHELRTRIAQLESKEVGYLKRIEELEKQSKAYQAEKNDETARNDMKDDGIIQIQNISPNMAKQIMKSFEQNYDIQATKNIEDLRQRHPEHNDVKEYDRLKYQYNALKEKFQ